MAGQRRLSSALALASLALPLATFYSGRPWQQVYDSGFFSTPLWGITALALAIIGIEIIVPWNGWIGWWAVSIALVSPLAEPYSLAMAQWALVGAFMVMAVGRIERRWTVLCLTVFGLVECGLLFMQWGGYYLAIGDWQWQTEIPHGTFGNPRYLAVALAMIGALAPWWSVPVFLVGLLLCKSYVALAAFTIALIVRYRKNPIACGVVVGACFLAGNILYRQRFFTHDSWDSRLYIWSLGMDEVVSTPWSIVFGLGDGTWFTHMMNRSMGMWFAINGHSEFFQMFYERGIVGIAVLVAFLVVHRRWFVREPAVLALGLCCLTLSALHLTMVAPVACIVIGLAAAEPHSCA